MTRACQGCGGGFDVAVVKTLDAVVFPDADNVGHHAIPVKIRYASGGRLEIDDVFVDALDGSVLGRHARVFRARHRQIYSADYMGLAWLPGRLLFEEGGTPTDVAAVGAYDGI